MSEQQKMDAWLREAMSGGAPVLSAAFDTQLAKRLRPRRLTARGRVLMAAYTVAALLFSVWALRNAALEWPFVVAALVPCVVIAATYGRRITGHAR
jgi:hypothetical protein